MYKASKLDLLERQKENLCDPSLVGVGRQEWKLERPARTGGGGAPLTFGGPGEYYN